MYKRQVSILCDIIRGKDAKTACVYLMQTPKAASEPMLKLLKSAIANAAVSYTHLDVYKRQVKTLCFLQTMDDFAAFNGVYARYFTEKPARSCVAVRTLPKGVLVEVEAIAEL